MRKDKGLNGDLDRLPMLTWIMFLKFLNDLELKREEEWKLVAPTKSTPHPGPLPGRGGEGKGFKPAIEPPDRGRAGRVEAPASQDHRRVGRPAPRHSGQSAQRRIVK